MKLSRVAKFKEYRDSFTKENALDIDGANDIISGLKTNKDTMSTTNTLPYETVMQEVQIHKEEEEEIKEQRRKRILIYSLIGFGALVVVVGLVFLGIIAFRG
ncbi:MAG: hypothetical protein MJ217_02530 [Bacilli bacterium]|nr:hypothetical protein [Bacilli bacterium]